MDVKGDKIKAFANRFWSGQEAGLSAALDRLQRLRPTLESILEAEGVPKQLIAVVLIESGAQQLAISPRQARGLWQFIPETARQYGLTVSEGIDERIHSEAAASGMGGMAGMPGMTIGDKPTPAKAQPGPSGAKPKGMDDMPGMGAKK